MDASYGIGVANRYALFMGDEDQDPLDSGLNHQLKPAGKENKESKSTSAPPAKKPAPSAPSRSAGLKQAVPASAPQTTGANQTSASGPKGSKPQQQASRTSSGLQASGPKKTDGAPVSDGGSRPTGPRLNNRGPQNDRNAPRQTDGTRNFGPGGESRPKRVDRIVRPSGDRPSAGGNQESVLGGSRDQKEMDERKNYRNQQRDRRPAPLQPNNSGAPVENPDGGEGRTRPRDNNRQFGNRNFGRGGPRVRSDNRDTRGKPVFDRHSGNDKTGVKPVEKKDGGGAHNWGTINDELEGQVAPADETQAGDRSGDETIGDQTENQNGVDSDAAKAAAEEEEGAKEMTLDEWKKLERETAKKAQPKFNLRKPGEGEDTAQWKKTYLLTKKKEEEETTEEYEEITYEVEEDSRRPKKEVIKIDINFRDPKADDRRRDRGPRGPGGPPRPDQRGSAGGRGGPRTDGDRPQRQPRGPRGPKNREQAAPRVDDINDFPSLVAA